MERISDYCGKSAHRSFSYAFAGLFLLLIPAAWAERANPLGCSQESPSFYDYQKSIFPPPDLPVKTVEDYLIVQRLGSGKFSDVFEAVDVQREQDLTHPGNASSTLSSGAATVIDPRTVVVLKCLKPVSERKIRREVKILQQASNLPNLARIRALVLPTADARGETVGVPTLVLEHAGSHCRWLSHYGGGSTTMGAVGGTVGSKILDVSQQQPPGDDEDDDDEEDTTLSDYEIRYYIFHLLVALDSLHQKGIMHRDVKPRNCLIRRMGHTGDRQHLWWRLYSSSTTELLPTSVLSRGSPLMLIDLGLADFYLPNQKYNVRVASRHYKSPELLVGYEQYDYALDLWGVGCIFASLLCFREPFFRGKDNLDQLGKIIMQLGTTDLLSYILKYNIQLDPKVQELIKSYHATGQYLSRKQWAGPQEPSSPRRVPDPKGLDLLDKLLVYDHELRWNARQAMDHPFFDIVRRRVLTEVRSYDAASPSKDAERIA